MPSTLSVRARQAAESTPRKNRERVATPTPASRAALRSGVPARTLSAAACSMMVEALGRPMCFPAARAFAIPSRVDGRVGP